MRRLRIFSNLLLDAACRNAKHNILGRLDLWSDSCPPFYIQGDSVPKSCGTVPATDNTKPFSYTTYINTNPAVADYRGDRTIVSAFIEIGMNRSTYQDSMPYLPIDQFGFYADSSLKDPGTPCRKWIVCLAR